MENLKRKWNEPELTGCSLKWIGIMAMLIDHIGAVFFPDIWIFRAIGRISFPIFAFTTAVGFMYTHNIFRYGMRLLLLAIISEPIFDMTFYGTPIFLLHQNVFFTLAVGVWMLYIWIQTDNLIFRGISVILLMILTELLKTDYNSMGLLMILIFYCFYNENLKRNILIAVVNILLMGKIQIFAVCSLLPISMYKGEEGRKMKKVFYIIYPLHLLLLSVIRGIIG
nr:TraX family protein [uncultured Sellimonas sp.]